MADKSLVDVPKVDRVSDAEIEAFRLERFGEKQLIAGIRDAVANHEMKLSPRNSLLMSVRRLLVNYKV